MPHAASFSSTFLSRSSRLAVFLVLLTVLMLPAAGQVSYTGTAASQNFGSLLVGSAKTESLSFSVAAGTTVGSIGVVTQGAPNLDFANAAGTTCTATTYASAATCVVKVTFTPKAAGLRMGAVVFFSGAGNTGSQLGSVFVHGSGEGPQIAFSPAVAIAIEPVVDGLPLAGGPGGVAVDAAGDIFVTDSGNNRVVEIPAGGGAPTAIVPNLPGENFQSPQGIAVDGAGNLFFASYYTFVVEMPAGGGAPIIVLNGQESSFMAGLAVDGLGDLYVTQGGQTVEVPPGGAPIYFSYGGATGAAVDAQGDVYYAEWCCGDWVKVAPDGTQTDIFPTVNGQAFGSPISVAVDAASDLYVGDMHSGTAEVPSSGQAASAIAPIVNGNGLGGPNDIVLDGAGNLYIANSGANPLVEILRSQPAPLSFAVTNVGSTSTDSPKAMQISNSGNQPLTFSAFGFPADFFQAASVANTCATSASLIAGHFCVLPIDFTPANVGSPLSEEVTITDNALNVTTPTQSIAVAGTAVPAGEPTHFSITTTASVVAGAPFTVTVRALTSNGTAATAYTGTVSFTSSDPLFVNPGTLTLSGGVGQKTVTLYTAGPQTITAADTTTAAVNGSASFAVAAATVASLQITNVPSSTYAGAQFQFTVTAMDAYGNAALATISFASTDPLASLPVTTALSGGTGAFYATLMTGGSQTITATVSASSVSATSSTIAVIGALNLVVTTSLDDAGTASNCTVQAAPQRGTDAACSLRDALLEAVNLGSTVISFDATVFATPQTITLGSAGTLTIPSNTAVTGSVAGQAPATTVTVNGGGQYTVFTVNTGVPNASISWLAITGGQGGNGGGIVNNGTLTVSNSALFGNAAWPAGAIYNSGTLTVVGCTISGNSNASAWNTGAITNVSYGILTVLSSTVAENAGLGVSSNATMTMANSLLAGNSGGDFVNFNYVYNDDGGNVVGSTGSSLTPVANYGGPFRTTAPLPGNAAICGGKASNAAAAHLTTDLRGFPFDPLCPAGSIDSGAVQSNYNLAFTTEPQESVTQYQLFTTAPAVKLTESGVTATAATNMVTLTDGTGQMTGTTTASLSSGSASFSGLAVPVAASNDVLKATIALNSAMNLTAQSSPIQVNAPGPGMLYLPIWGSVLAGPTVMFTWEAGAVGAKYSLYLGSTGVGSSNVYNSGATTATTITATGLPTNGETVYARLNYIVNGVAVHSDYTYIAASRAALTSPAPGTTWLYPVQTFTWSAATEATGYSLWVGSTGVGSHNLFSSGNTTGTTVTTGLPMNGEAIYVRLYTHYNTLLAYNDYTYTSNIPAALTSPAPGSTLTGPVATFTWSAAHGAASYTLFLGTSGVGSDNLYNSGGTTATSLTVAGLPTNGQTIYAQVNTIYSPLVYYESYEESTDFTFTAATAPVITTQPVSQTVPDGSTATFSVVATGTGTLNYAWQYLSGSTWKPFGAGTGLASATMTTAATTAAFNGIQFRVVVTDVNGNAATSNTVTLTVTGPVITTQPASQTVAAGSTATFSVTATGTGTLSYVWQYLSGSAWKPFGAGTGQTSATMTTVATTPVFNGLQFRVVVTDGYGISAISNTATLTVE